MADAVYCAGVDLRQYLTPIGLLKGFIDLPPGVGADYAIPGYVGALPAQLGRGPRNVTVGGLILGWDPEDSALPQVNVEQARAAYHTKLTAFGAAVFQNGDPYALTWVTGPPGSEVTRVASARYLSGLGDVEELTPWAGRVAIELLLLTPYWQ